MTFIRLVTLPLLTSGKINKLTAHATKYKSNNNSCMEIA